MRFDNVAAQVSPLLVRDDITKHAQLVGFHGDFVSGLQPVLFKRGYAAHDDPFTGAGIDDIAGVQLKELRYIGDLRRDIKNHLADQAVLPYFAVDGAADVECAFVDGILGNDSGAERAESINRFADEPLFGAELQIPRGKVVALGVAVDVVAGLLIGDIAASLADIDDD